MENILVPKEVFSKIITDVEILIEDVEMALDTKIRQRIEDIKSKKAKGKSEREYYDYLEKRGVKVGRVHN